MMMQIDNNRFKFRVWDKKNNEYVPEGQMCDVVEFHGTDRRAER